MTLAAWVNWNPEPRVHAFGRWLGNRAIALCNTQVRETWGDFDPDDPMACARCVEIASRESGANPALPSQPPSVSRDGVTGTRAGDRSRCLGPEVAS